LLVQASIFLRQIGLIGAKNGKIFQKSYKKWLKMVANG